MAIPLKLLVAAAWEPELTQFRNQLAAGPAPDGLEIVLAPLGVGVVEAAIGMTQCVARHGPDLALLLGTCGSLPSPGGATSASRAAGAAFEVVVASRIRLVDHGASAGVAELPAPMPGEAVLDPSMHDALVSAGARSVQIANTLGITIDDGVASKLAGTGHDVEHLEAFAFARACACAGVPCGVVLGVANVVGANGRAEWLANHERASARAGDVAWGALTALAGLPLRRSTRAPSRGRD